MITPLLVRTPGANIRTCAPSLIVINPLFVIPGLRRKNKLVPLSLFTVRVPVSVKSSPIESMTVEVVLIVMLMV